jgi:hypothetical protein
MNGAPPRDDRASLFILEAMAAYVLIRIKQRYRSAPSMRLFAAYRAMRRPHGDCAQNLLSEIKLQALITVIIEYRLRMSRPAPAAFRKNFRANF